VQMAATIPMAVVTVASGMTTASSDISVASRLDSVQ
jgi:hypothetical protein